MTKEEIKIKLQNARDSAKKAADNNEALITILISLQGVNKQVLDYIVDRAIVESLTTVIDMLEKEEVVGE